MPFGSGPAGAGAGAGTGSSSLFGSLNLDTSVPSSADPTAKRKSIFEPSSTTEARSKSGMFGPTPSSSASTAGGLFGNAASTNPAAATTTTSGGGGGLFGSTTTPTASSSGTGGFGLFNKPQPSAPASTGLFGTTSTAQPAQSTGLFGSSTAATKPLFGQTVTTTAPAPTTTSTTGFGSLFGQQTGASNLGASTMTQPQTVAQQPEIQAQNRESAYFNGLLERQKKKIKFNDNDASGRIGSLPSMNMDLGDLTRRAQELGQKSQSIGQSTSRDSRAHYLLSGSGVTPGQAYRDFQKLDEDTLPPAQQPRADFAEEGSAYLTGMQAKGREAMLRESMDRVYRDVDAFIEQSLGVDFDEQKKRIMQHFGLLPKDITDGSNAAPGALGASRPASKNKSGRRSIFGRSGLDKSIIGTASAAVNSSSFFGDQNGNVPPALSKNQTVRDLREKERLFMQKVEALNQSRLQESNYKILQGFKEVESRVPGDVPKQLVDAYAALEEITKENASDNGLRERCFAEAHANNDQSTRGAVDLKKQILEGARRYLEKSFYQELEEIIQKNPRQAQLGGMPTIVAKVRAYIRVRHEQHNLAQDGVELTRIGDDGDYCYIIIFYLLRSGHLQEAVQYVNNNPAFLSLDRRFVGYLSSYASTPDRRLSRKMQEMVDGVYQQLTRVAPKGTTDPYRIACLKIIGRCDLLQRNLDSIGQGVEDWIWLQFALAREAESPEDVVGEIFGLEQITETVSEIGQKHFQKGHAETANSYGTYFLMQILAGMFEQAIDYLHSFNSVSAVHAAIALDYYGLLRVSDFQTAGNELLTFTTTTQPQINFVPLIAYYTSTFRAALPVQSVDYLALICLNSDLHNGEIFTNACHECLRELCLETREFAALLGDIRSDGTRIAGAIEKRARIISLDSHEQFLRSITSQAAAVADSRGQIADAVLLYHLCDDFDNVTAVLNRALADAISVELGEEPMSLQPLKPRNNSSSASDTTSQASQQPNSSLSLTQSTSSPFELAKNITNLYDSNAMYFSRISTGNRMTCRVLMTMLSARAKLEHPTNPEYLRALEELNSMSILPLDSRGDIPTIRQMATSFSSLPQTVARCAGMVILWCVRAIGAERERVTREGTWGIPGASEDDVNQLKGQLSQMAKDLMVFAGLVRYKLPSRVYDLLTRAGGDVGGY